MTVAWWLSAAELSQLHISGLMLLKSELEPEPEPEPEPVFSIEEIERDSESKDEEVELLLARLEKIAKTDELVIGQRIAYIVGKEDGVSYRTLVSTDRSAEVAKVRHRAIHEIRKTTTLSYARIGKHIFGGRDHSTMVNGHRAHQRLIGELA